MSLGNFAYGGVQRSYSFENFWADMVPNSTDGEQCPDMPCEQVWIQNDPDSTDNVIIGDLTRLQETGHGIVLEPGKTTGWMPCKNLNLIAHLDLDATSHLNYMIVR